LFEEYHFNASSNMAFYQFKRTMALPVTINQLWDFISSPSNLKEITPPKMGFRVTNDVDGVKMYPGMIITYKVTPIMGIELTWVTEITQVKEKESFVDEQRVGPYAMWHHEHKIEPITDGVLMTDIVSYQPPLGILGTLANQWFIDKSLREIFDYRSQVLQLKFGKYIPRSADDYVI